MQKKVILSCVLSILFLSAFSLLLGSGWTINPKDVQIKFALTDKKHPLSFSDIKADLNFDPLDLKNSELITRINVNSLQSDDPGLTKHLLSIDFFDVDKFPQIKFITTRIEKSDTGYTAYGALAIKDSVHIISLPFTFDQKGEDGIFKGEFSIFCGDYGVMKKSKSGGDEVIVSLEIGVIRSKGQ